MEIKTNTKSGRSSESLRTRDKEEDGKGSIRNGEVDILVSLPGTGNKAEYLASYLPIRVYVEKRKFRKIELVAQGHRNSQ